MFDVRTSNTHVCSLDDCFLCVYFVFALLACLPLGLLCVCGWLMAANFKCVVWSVCDWFLVSVCV